MLLRKLLALLSRHCPPVLHRCHTVTRSTWLLLPATLLQNVYAGQHDASTEASRPSDPAEAMQDTKLPMHTVRSLLLPMSMMVMLGLACWRASSSQLARWLNVSRLSQGSTRALQ